jgi:hypothetical protein
MDNLVNEVMFSNVGMTWRRANVNTFAAVRNGGLMMRHIRTGSC